ANHKQLAAVQAQVRISTEKLRHLIPPVDDIADDVFGCLFDASRHFATTQGKKVLVIASAMENNTRVNDIGSLSLSGVAVQVIWFRCTTASACQETMTHWTAVFQ